MKKKIKLIDLTPEQYEKWVDDNCLEETISCFTCPFRKVQCEPKFDNCRVKNKDVYDKDFLNQEIEIDIPDLLTQEEKEYLEAALRPFKNRVDYVELDPYLSCDDVRMVISIKNYNSVYSDLTYLPVFRRGTMYKGLEEEKQYTLEELGLFQNEKKYKIKFSEFWKSKERLYIRPSTIEQYDIFCKKADELGKKWYGGKKYTEFNVYSKYKDETCLNNRGSYTNYDEISIFHVYNFEDVDFDN